MEIRCLTVQYPLAQMIVEGFKEIELRNWLPKVKGTIAIHCGKSTFQGEFISPNHFVPRPELKGKLLGFVDINEVRPAVEADKILALVDIGNYKFSWILTNPRVLHNPPNVKGQLGIFNRAFQEPLN